MSLPLCPLSLPCRLALFQAPFIKTEDSRMLQPFLQSGVPQASLPLGRSLLHLLQGHSVPFEMRQPKLPTPLPLSSYHLHGGGGPVLTAPQTWDNSAKQTDSRFWNGVASLNASIHRHLTGVGVGGQNPLKGCCAPTPQPCRPKMVCWQLRFKKSQAQEGNDISWCFPSTHLPNFPHLQPPNANSWQALETSKGAKGRKGVRH